jgi:hypothetical protein
MTEALAFLLATCAACCDPASLAAHSSTPVATASERLRVAWDPETNSWGAMPGAPGASMDSATSLGGPALPFDAPVEFALPSGGHGVALGRTGMENIRVVRGKDGRFHAICEPATEPSVGSTGATDR